MKKLKIKITQQIEVEVEFPYYSKYIASTFHVYTKIDDDKIYSIQKHMNGSNMHYLFQVEPFETPSTYFDTKHKSSKDEWEMILNEFEDYFSYHKKSQYAS